MGGMTRDRTHIILPLWKGSVPNLKNSIATETRSIKEPGLTWIEKVVSPTIEVFLPAKGNANGKAVLICPGGGYEGVAYDWEGTDIAKLLNSKGIAGIVLKYRLPDPALFTNSPFVPLQDVQRAIRLIRYHAKKWNVDDSHVGVMGFSAGGHLASTLGTHFNAKTLSGNLVVDTLSARPDFMILMYPVISMKDGLTHEGSRNALLGNTPAGDLTEEFSNELQVKNDTPPAFIVHSADDDTVPVENSLVFFSALKKKNIPVEMHIYPDGGHGYSLALNNSHLSTWAERMLEWIGTL